MSIFDIIPVDVLKIMIGFFPYRNWMLLCKRFKSLALSVIDPNSLLYYSGDALFVCVINNKLDSIRGLLNHPKTTISPNKNFLYYAITRNMIEVVRLLLKYTKIEPLLQNEDLLTHAVLHGFTEIVKLLLEHPKIIPRIERLYIKYNNSEALWIYLTNPRVDITENKNSALKYAAGYNYKDIVELILKRVDINQDDLHIAFGNALIKNSIDVVKLFLQDSRINPIYNENSLITRAVSNRSYESLELLVKDSRLKPFIVELGIFEIAYINGRLNLLKNILEDPDFDPSINNNDAILFAFGVGDYDTIRLLINHPRFDVNINIDKILGYSTNVPFEILNKIKVLTYKSG